MALYLGSDKVRINFDSVVYCLNLFTATSTTNTNVLLSSDNYILQDSNGIYLIPSDYVASVVDNILLSSDNYILQDSNGVYLVIKESE